MTPLQLLLATAAALLGQASAQSCAANTTCPTNYPTGHLLLKPACPGPNVTMQQFNPGECINTTTLVGNSSAVAAGIKTFKAVFVDGADFYVPEVVLYPAEGCNASASTAKTWAVKMPNRDRYDRKTTPCHSFTVGGKLPGSVRFTVRAVARRRTAQ